jgi:hypothetical protein
MARQRLIVGAWGTGEIQGFHIVLASFVLENWKDNNYVRLMLQARNMEWTGSALGLMRCVDSYSLPLT